MENVGLFKDVIEQYENQFGAEEAKDFTQFLINTYIDIIFQFGALLLQQNLDPSLIEKIILEIINKHTEKRNRFQKTDKDKKVLYQVGAAMTEVITASIKTLHSNINELEKTPETLH